MNWFCWHNWGKWEYFDEVKITEIYIPTNQSSLKEILEVQKRVCLKCGLVRYRRERR